jgi:hypothetical protein
VLKRKPAAGIWQRVLEIVFALLLAWFCQRREHDRQPATRVVVMPICMMAVIVIDKHCSGLIPESAADCQSVISCRE